MAAGPQIDHFYVGLGRHTFAIQFRDTPVRTALRYLRASERLSVITTQFYRTIGTGTCTSIELAKIRREVLTAADGVVLLADSSKIFRRAFCNFRPSRVPPRTSKMTTFHQGTGLTCGTPL